MWGWREAGNAGPRRKAKGCKVDVKHLFAFMTRQVLAWLDNVKTHF